MNRVSISWTEEVQLSDGTLIDIKRTMVREAVGEPGFHGKVLEQKISYKTATGEIVWPGKIDPLIFDLKDGRYYVVAVPRTGEECELYGRQDSPFVFYVFANSEWKTIDPKEFPDGFKKNLLWNAWKDNQPARVTIKEKESRDFSISSRDMRQFDKSNTKPCRHYS